MKCSRDGCSKDAKVAIGVHGIFTSSVCDECSFGFSLDMLRDELRERRRLEARAQVYCKALEGPAANVESAIAAALEVIDHEKAIVVILEAWLRGPKDAEGRLH